VKHCLKIASTVQLVISKEIIFTTNLYINVPMICDNPFIQWMCHATA